MDIATPIGIVAGFALIGISMFLGGSMSAYFDIPSIIIVVGGTIAATLISEKLPNVIGAMKVARNAFRMPAGDLNVTIATILRLSKVARKDGLLALEKETFEDPFLAKAVRMAVDGLPAEEIRETLSAELLEMKKRHQRGQKLFRFMGATAPAMGMIGTLVGLVAMLRSLEDPSAIGPAMAVALLTTLYGAVIAFLLCNPIAEKLERYTAEESANMVVTIEGVDSIVKGLNAMVIKEKLNARLSPKQREADSAEAA